MAKKVKKAPGPILRKVPTGITGFDQITLGGLPAGRPTLVCGSAGCGKSLFATEFLLRGIKQFDEPGVLMTFEEGAEDIKKNVASLGFDLNALISRKKLIIDHVHVERSEIEENGEYDLEGLFIRLGHAVDSIGAKRVVLDTIETLFAGLDNQAILRAELRRLFSWLRERGLTTIITGERGDGTLTRHGLEEYVSDCVILLDHRVQGQISTRRLRVVKYRGSTHGTNEYPFLIDEQGISVMPLTTAAMNYGVSEERVSSGIRELDAMIGGKGFYRGSTVLISGTAGTGKTTLAAYVVDAACKRGERSLYFSFEESPAQLLRNMRSIGINLARHVKSGLLQFHSTRPSTFGLEMHLVRMHKLIEDFKPTTVVVDPVTNLQNAGTLEDSTAMLVRLIDFLRNKNILGYLVGLTRGGEAIEATNEGLSSLADAWLLLRDLETAGERNRVLYVLKARGSQHSNQLREFMITSKGVRLVPAYLGQEGVLTGSARVSQEARDMTQKRQAKEEIERRQFALERRRKAIDAQIHALQAEFYAEEQEFARTARADSDQLKQAQSNLEALSASRSHGVVRDQTP